MGDRELDVKIAEFMAWTPIPHEDGWQSADGQSKHWPGPPCFSTEIKAAMEVVEKMRGDGWNVMLRGDAGGRWNVEIDKRPPGCIVYAGPRALVSRGSLPRAICEASLAAIETK